jgi:hypothetical protein
MIRENSSHPADGQKAGFDVLAYERSMPADFRREYQRVKASPEGRQALARYKKFWGIMPTEIKSGELPGGNQRRTKFLVGMGKAGKGGKILTPAGSTMTAKGAKLVACDASGKQIILLSGKNSTAPKAKLKEVGVVEETHYIPTSSQERAKTFKRGAYWVHKHNDDGGKFPKVYKDQAGNYVYGPGTYKVTDWIRK